MRIYILLLMSALCLMSWQSVAQEQLSTACLESRKLHRTVDMGRSFVAPPPMPAAPVFRIYDTNKRKPEWFTISINRSYMGHLDFDIRVNGTVECIDKGDSVAFVFRDGSYLRMLNARDSNCEGKLLLVLGEKVGTQHQLTIFGTKEIKSMKVQKNTRTQKIEFPENDSQAIRQLIQCLAGMKDEPELLLTQEKEK